MTTSERHTQKMQIIKKYTIITNPKTLIITYIDDGDLTSIQCESETGMENMLFFLIDNLIFRESQNAAINT